jgi:hypothetical protein
MVTPNCLKLPGLPVVCMEFDSKLNCKQFLAESICNKEPMETVALLFFYQLSLKISCSITQFMLHFHGKAISNQVKQE